VFFDDFEDISARPKLLAKICIERIGIAFLVVTQIREETLISQADGKRTVNGAIIGATRTFETREDSSEIPLSLPRRFLARTLSRPDDTRKTQN
jgi:hypothetical protein